MDIEYIRCGDYLLPNIVLSDHPGELPLGRYGIMRKAFLKEHKPILYSQLLMSERLYPLCRAVDNAATERFVAIGDHEIAREIILSELVYD
jgi:hypothetical protein